MLLAHKKSFLPAMATLKGSPEKNMVAGVNPYLAATSAMKARMLFPRGLMQPQDCFRFSTDALLLAAFGATSLKASAPKAQKVIMDLGTGCGVVALGMLLLVSYPIHGVGLDIDPELTASAQANASHLGFEHRFTVYAGDIGTPDLQERILRQHGQAELVLANPPWRLEGSGRLPALPSRRRALFGTPETFPRFVAAAKTFLSPTGRFLCILGADRLPAMLEAVSDSRLFPHHLRLVCPSQNKPAVFAFLEAGLENRPFFNESPLYLYRNDGGLGEEALRLCPFLRPDGWCSSSVS